MKRHRVHVSPQLQHLLDAGGGPWWPRRREEPPSELVGHGGTEWGGEVEARQDRCPWGVAERGEGFPHLEGPSGAQIRGGRGPVFPLPNRPGKSARLLGQVLRPQTSSPGQVGPGGVGGSPGENRGGRWEGPSRTRGGGKEQRALAPPTGALAPPRLGGWGGACWAPRLVPRPPKPPPGCMCPGGIGGRPGRPGEAGRRGPPGQEEQEGSRGHLPRPLAPRKPAGLPGGVPHPLRPEGRGMPGPLLFCWA